MLKVTWMSCAITRAFLYRRKPTKQELGGKRSPCEPEMGLGPSVKFMSWYIKLKNKIGTKQRQTGSIWPRVHVCHNRVKFFWLQVEVGQNNTTPSYFKLIAIQPSQEFNFQPPTFFFPYYFFFFLSISSAQGKNLSSLNDNWLYYLWLFRNAVWQGF